MGLGFNIKIVTKIPVFVKEALEGMKGDLEEVTEAVKKVKEEQAMLKTNAETCANSSLTGPVECYKQIFGPIVCSAEERKAWEAKMTARAKDRGTTFNPADYP